ncbi:unnamed protein product [Rhizophagus irregularis]|nr:unnamed protein product [Rhizophagus irregularis]
MPVQLPLDSYYSIDSDEARNVEVTSTLCRIFYHHLNIRGLPKNCMDITNAGLISPSDEVQDWLERQAVIKSQTHPRFIPHIGVQEFKGECEKLDDFPWCKIQKAKSKRTVGIVKQDLESGYKKSRVSSKSSYPRDGPVGYKEEKLPPDISVRYLLEPNDLEGGRRRAEDMNWSPKIYHIHMSLTQKINQFYTGLLMMDGKELERSFVREELLVIPDDTELHHNGMPALITAIRADSISRKALCRPCVRPEGCHIHWKTKSRFPCAVCGKPTGSSSGRCQSHIGSLLSKSV